MKIFVSDSGPIISFARAGYLDLLHQIINELWIPEAVYREIIVKGKGRPGTGAVLNEKWIKKRKIPDKTSLNLFSSGLGLGEREAILLTEELKGVLIIDDKKARQEAGRKSIETIGSLRIIKEAKNMRLITEVKTVVEEIRDSGLWIKDSLYHQFLKEMGEG
jgi:predicted nucleic acid-binding protein